MTSESSLASACGWIDTHLVEFEIRAGVSFEGLIASLKAVAELAHAADFLLRSERASWIAIGRRWMDFAWDQTRQGTLIRKLVEKDARLFPLAATFLPFHLSGHQNHELRESIARMLAQATMEDVAWTLLIPALLSMGFQVETDLIAKARPRSVLANGTNAANLSDDDVYILMHECLYATGWGRTASHGADDYLAAALPSLVTRMADNADLLAEAILVSHVVSLPCVEARAWEALERAQTAEGNVVSPEEMITAFPRAKHPVLGRTYHTTIAAILAWSACLARCRTVAR